MDATPKYRTRTAACLRCSIAMHVVGAVILLRSCMPQHRHPDGQPRPVPHSRTACNPLFFFDLLPGARLCPGV